MSNRPELDAAVEACRKTGATLLIAKLDRLARNVAFIANLLESGVKFVAVDKRGLTYTRYADDITISSEHWIDEEVLQDVSGLVQEFGFKLNAKKTKFMGPGDRQEVTGIVLNSSPNLPRDWCNSVRGYLHRVKLAPHKHVDEYAKVQGILGTLLAADPQAKRKITKTARETVNLVMLEKLMQ